MTETADGIIHFVKTPFAVMIGDAGVTQHKANHFLIGLNMVGGVVEVGNIFLAPILAVDVLS